MSLTSLANPRHVSMLYCYQRRMKTDLFCGGITSDVSEAMQIAGKHVLNE